MLKAEFERVARPGLENTPALVDDGLSARELRKEREQDQYRLRAEDERDRKRRQEESKDIGDDVSDLQAKVEQRANELRNRIEIARANTIEDILRHERELARINGELADLQANAIILSDGRQAYIDQNGAYVTEDGAALSDEELEGAQFPQDAPTRYEDVQDKRAEQAKTQEDLDGYRERLEQLDSIEVRLDSDDDLTMDDLDDLERDFEAALVSDEPAQTDPAPASSPTIDPARQPEHSAPAL